LSSPYAPQAGRRSELRVLLVHNRYRSRFASGENRMVEQETTLLREAGHDVVEYLRESDEIERFSAMRRLELPARVVWSREDARMVTGLARRSRPDVVHIHNTFPLISPSVIRSLAALEIPIVMTLHNPRLFCANAMLFRDGRPCEDCLGASPLPGLVHACYRDSRIATAPITASIAVHRRLDTWHRIAAFIVPSAFLRAKMVQGGLPLDRVVVKPNFAPAPARIRERAGSHTLFLGRLSHEKGPDLLVSAWDARFGELLLAGEGPLRSTLDRAGAAQGGVRFLGHRTATECSDLLRSSRALVVPSRVYEVFPVAVAEAFAHGVPVIAPAHGPFPDIVEEGVTGLLFEPGDAADLARCLRAVLDDPLSMRLGAQARKVYEARYTPERNLRSLESIYARVLGRQIPFEVGDGPVAAKEAGS
jgi:glycosyltransferase involved in cell wall biosynthesis